MNESTRIPAERPALVQRFQLDVLHRALQSLEARLTALESETDRQRAELLRLDRMIAQLRAEAGLTRASSVPDPDIQERTGTLPRPGTQPRPDYDVPEHHRPSPHETSVAPGPSPDLPAILPPPTPGEDWNAYLRHVDRYIVAHRIQVTPDPLTQLLPPHRAAEIRRQFDTDFGPAPWDRWDYGVVALAVIVGAATDYLLVATPGGKFKGKPQRGSPLTAWMKEQSKKLAPMAGQDDIERNAFQQWIAGLTTAAEKWAKMPYDVVSPKLGLTPNVHRLASLGHDPLLGLVFGVNDILSGTCTFIDKSGRWRVIDNPGFEGTGNPLEALVRVVVHGFSDVFTAQGLPPPFMALFQLVDAKPGFTLKEGGDPVAVRDVVRYMYANGYDLRHFMTTKISPAIAEAILGAYHGVRAFSTGAEPGEPGLPDKLKREFTVPGTYHASGACGSKSELPLWTSAMRLPSLVPCFILESLLARKGIWPSLERVTREYSGSPACSIMNRGSRISFLPPMRCRSVFQPFPYGGLESMKSNSRAGKASLERVECHHSIPP